MAAPIRTKIIHDYPFQSHDVTKKGVYTLIELLKKKTPFTEEEREDYLQSLVTSSIGLRSLSEFSGALQEAYYLIPKLLREESLIQQLPQDIKKQVLYNKTMELFGSILTTGVKKPLPTRKEKELRQITTFIQLLFKHYLSTDELSYSIKPLYDISSQLNQEFEAAFPALITEILPPSTNEALSKEAERIVSGLFRSVALFLSDLNEAESKGASLDDDQNMIYHLNEIYKNRGSKIIIPNSMNPQEISRNINERLRNLLDVLITEEGLSPTSGALVRFSKTLLSPLLLLLVYWVFTPYSISLMINRIFEWKSGEKSEGTSPPSKIPDNPEFSKKVGNAAVASLTALFNFGKADWMLGLLSGKIKSHLNTYSEDLGKAIQQLVKNLFQDNYLVKGLIFTDQILFDHSSMPPTPTLVGVTQVSDEEKLKFQKEVKERLNGKLFASIQQLLKSKSFPGYVAVSSFASVRNFCNRLSDRVYTIGQSTYLLQTLLCYLIDGIVDRKEIAK